MRDEKTVVFTADGITYTYHFTVDEYDGNKPIEWDKCIWQPKDLKQED